MLCCKWKKYEKCIGFRGISVRKYSLLCKKDADGLGNGGQTYSLVVYIWEKRETLGTVSAIICVYS